MRTNASNTSPGAIELSSVGSPDARSEAQLLTAMTAAISAGDASAASSLIPEAESCRSGDSAFSSAILKCKAIVHHAEWLDSALDSMERAFDEDRFATAVGHFREALGLSRSLPLLKARVDRHAERYSEQLLPNNWRIALTLLDEAGATDPPLVLDPDLTDKLNRARYDELITNAIFDADRCQLEGRIAEARQKLTDLLAVHPKENRITKRIQALDQPDSPRPPDLVVKLPANEVKAIAACLPARSPSENKIPSVDLMVGFRTPWRTKILMANSAWTAIKNFSALALTTAMLGAAGVLVWTHFSHLGTMSHSTVPTTPVSVPLKTAASPTAFVPLPAPRKSIFEDVPEPPSDQESIIQAVQAYSQTSGRQIGDDVVDELAIDGNQASVRYRPKDKSPEGFLTFSLVRRGNVWKVLNAR